MTPVGARLRAFAARICHPATMQRVIDPLIADLQHEFAEAVRRGEALRALRVRLAGYGAFWTVLVLQALFRRHGAEDDRAAARKILLIFVFATAALTALIALPPLLRTAATGEGWFDGRLILYLIPQAIPLSLPIGLALGVLGGVRGRAAPCVRRTILAAACAASVLSFLTIGWIVPEANQSFLDWIARERGVQIRIERGVNELPLAEMLKRIATMDPFTTSTLHLRHAYHRRYALSIAPVVFSFFALGLAAVARRRWIAIACGVVAVAAYWTALSLMESLVQTAPLLRVAAAWLPDSLFALAEAMKPAASLPLAAAWLPNVAIVLLGALLFKLRPSATRDTRIPLA